MARLFLSRRALIGGAGTGLAFALVAACGAAPAAPTAAPKPAEPAKPAAAATTAPAAAATQPAAAKPATASAGVTIWQYPDAIPETTSVQKDLFEKIGKDKGFPVTFEELAGNAGVERFNASIAANTPPDFIRVFDYQTQFWRIQGQTVDVSDIVKPYMAQKGGFWPAVEATCVNQGKWYGVPWGINCWPFHVRQDILDKAGMKWPKDWDEFRAQGRELNKPPLGYYGMCLGKVNDVNNHVTGMVWTFGGKLQNEDGSLAVKPGDKAWLDTLGLIQAMYNDDKIIPQGAINWDDGSNNMAYQSEQLVATSNPTSIYTWLINNKPEIAKGTKFYNYPAGPAGSFGQVDVWSQGLFKNGKGGDNARVLLTAFLEPVWYEDYINKKLKGRFVPVYKDMIKDDLWTKNPTYEQYQNIIQNGRIMAHAASPQTATAEVTTKFIIADIVQDMLVKKQKPADALATFAKAAEEIYAKPENRK